MVIKIGPSTLGPVKTSEAVLEQYAKAGLQACEIAFTYSIYIKNKSDAIRIGKKAEELGIELSIHAPFFVNLNSSEAKTRESTKKRILDCCEIGELLGAKIVVFHPGYYGDDREGAYDTIKSGIVELMEERAKKKWKIKIGVETMGKVNVFGSLEEISRLVHETGCSFCIDFAHILARDKKVDYARVERLFPQKEWHVHFSGIEYGEKGEKKHRDTEEGEWSELLENLPKDKDIRIVSEAPSPFEDAKQAIRVLKGMK